MRQIASSASLSGAEGAKMFGAALRVLCIASLVSGEIAMAFTTTKTHRLGRDLK